MRATVQVHTLWAHFLVSFVTPLQLIAGTAHHSCVEESFILATFTRTRSYLIVTMLCLYEDIIAIYFHFKKVFSNKRWKTNYHEVCWWYVYTYFPITKTEVSIVTIPKTIQNSRYHRHIKAQCSVPVYYVLQKLLYSSYEAEDIYFVSA
mgnify:CR=1 FL=1